LCTSDGLIQSLALLRGQWEPIKDGLLINIAHRIFFFILLLSHQVVINKNNKEVEEGNGKYF
jgi:hypothetical protein